MSLQVEAPITLEESLDILKARRLSEVRRKFDVILQKKEGCSEESRRLMIDFHMMNYEFAKLQRYSANQLCAFFELTNFVFLYLSLQVKTEEDTLLALEEFISAMILYPEERQMFKKKELVAIFDYIKKNIIQTHTARMSSCFTV